MKECRTDEQKNVSTYFARLYNVKLIYINKYLDTVLTEIRMNSVGARYNIRDNVKRKQTTDFQHIPPS